jgi:hypothetical protein
LSFPSFEKNQAVCQDGLGTIVQLNTRNHSNLDIKNRRRAFLLLLDYLLTACHARAIAEDVQPSVWHGPDRNSAEAGITDDEIFCRQQDLLAEALSDGLSVHGALNALSLSAVRLYLRNDIGNPFDVHFLTVKTTPSITSHPARPFPPLSVSLLVVCSVSWAFHVRNVLFSADMSTGRLAVTVLITVRYGG